jgi:hypothetical protein
VTHRLYSTYILLFISPEIFPKAEQGARRRGRSGGTRGGVSRLLYYITSIILIISLTVASPNHSRILQGSGSLSLGSSSAAIRNASLVAAQSSSSVLDSKKKSVKKKANVNSTAAAAVLPTSRQSISAPVNNTISNQQPPQQTPRTTSTAEALLNMSAFTGPMDEFYADSSITAVNNDQYDHSHGFYPYTEEVSDPISHYTTTNTTAINNSNTAYNTQLQIKAPQDLSTNSNYNKYPEPSPAACGKRKIAEITAAQMLVGVHNHVVNDPTSGVNDPTANSTVIDPTINSANVNDSNTTTNNEGNNEYYYSEYSPNPLQKESYFEMGGVSEDDAFLAEVFGVDHPAQGAAATSASGHGGGGGGDGGIVGNNNMGGSGLQIVNPDTFGDASFGRRRSVGGRQVTSPGTPWDGQLEALVR